MEARLSGIIIINGPNLNLLGNRQTAIYGRQPFEAYFDELTKQFNAISISYFQSNIEGEMINALHEAAIKNQGVVINAGGYTHTSVSLADAVAAIQHPVVEVHISNLAAREPFRHTSLITPYAKGCIVGFGLEGYRLAIQWFMNANLI